MAQAFASGSTGADEAAAAILKQYASKKDLTDWEAILLGVNAMPIKTPFFATPYFKRLEKEVTAKGGEYRLLTDYARIAICYKSHGKNPANIAGYDFISKIKNFFDIRKQGANACVWALIALHGQDAKTTEPFVKALLEFQYLDNGQRLAGGFGLKPVTAAADTAGTADMSKPEVDLTAMAVTALSPYTADETVKAAVDRAVAFLAEMQQNDGEFMSYDIKNAESVSQVIIALCAAGVDIDRDNRFIKNNKTPMDVLAAYRLADGNYAHTSNGNGILKADAIATRQALLAVCAYRKAVDYNAQPPAQRSASGIKRGVFEW